jgi:hypothetical protein
MCLSTNVGPSGKRRVKRKFQWEETALQKRFFLAILPADGGAGEFGEM